MHNNKSECNPSWTTDEIGRLICLIRSCPELYDKSCPGYTCKENYKIWERISAQIETKQVSQCKSKWRSLRTKYVQYIRSDRRTPCFYDLSFLKKHVYDEETAAVVSDAAGSLSLQQQEEESEDDALVQKDTLREASDKENKILAMKRFLFDLLDEINMLPAEKQLCFKIETTKLLQKLLNDANIG